MIEMAGPDCPYLGPLVARLVELGHDANGLDDTDRRQIYADTMHRLQVRLDDDPLVRHEFSLHPRTFGRPARHLVTSADDWVVPMVEAEAETLSCHDRSILGRNIVMRVGRQADIHADFRPLLLRLATEDHILGCLAKAELAPAAGGGRTKSHLLAAVARPFVDVVMADADDGIELEAAAWRYAQRSIERAVAHSRSSRNPAKNDTENDLLQTVGEASSLLSMIDASRTHAAEQSPAQAHAGLATKTAVAEFLFSSLVLVASKPEMARVQQQQGVDSFIRREFVGRSSISLPTAAFEDWARGRSLKRLLLDLVMMTLVMHRHGHGNDLPSAIDDLDPSTGSFDLNGDLEGDLGGIAPIRAAVDVINHHWQVDGWAGAA
jgi:hypothetical protein